MSVNHYASNLVALREICNTQNQPYYGDITTNYNQTVSAITSDIGTVLALSTFSTVPGSIAECEYNANIIQYNTGTTWNGPANLSGGGQAIDKWTSISISSNGTKAVACSGTSTTGYVYYSSDYGNTWTQSSSGSGNWTAVSISSNGTYAIACTNSLIHYSSTSGASWIASNFEGGGPAAGNWSSVSISSSGQYAVACISGGSTYWSSSYGQTWNIATSSALPWTSVSISSSGQYALGSTDGTAPGGTIYLSNDYGHTWSPTSTFNYMSSVSISSSGQYAVACSNQSGLIYYSNDYGSSWQTAATVNTWTSVSISSTGQYAVACLTFGGSGNIYWSNDYGATWTIGVPYSGNWTSVSISSSGQYALACINDVNGLIYYSSNTSTAVVNKDLTAVFEPLYRYYTWTAPSGLPAGNWGAVSMSTTGKYAIACLIGGIIYYSGDYGSTWNTSNSTTGNWTAVSMSSTMSSTGLYAIACTGVPNSGQIYYSNDSGQTWNLFATQPVPSDWSSVSISSSGKYAIICSYFYNGAFFGGGNIYYSNNYGQTWNISNIGGSGSDFFQSVSMSSTGQYCVACAAYIYYSSDYGATWFYGYTGNFGLPVSGLWFGVSISSSGKFAVASADGGPMYWSDDSGQTWNISSSGTNNWVPVSMSSSGQYAVAGNFNGIIYYSKDFGKTWNPSNSLPSSWQSISISGNGQYAIGCLNINLDPSGNVYRCIAKNSYN